MSDSARRMAALLPVIWIGLALRHLRPVRGDARRIAGDGPRCAGRGVSSRVGRVGETQGLRVLVGGVDERTQRAWSTTANESGSRLR